MNENNNPLVSIVMPVYNAGVYLLQCLNSLASQTLRDFECICIDDASNDDSLIILKKFADNDNRFTALNNHVNYGAARTRNIGLQMAHGKYIIFLDADDFFEEEFLFELANKLILTGADVVFCDYWVHNELTGGDNLIKREYPSVLKDKLTEGCDPAEIANVIFNITLAAPWNKMLKREYVMEEQLMFQDISSSNDVYFSASAMVAAKKIAYVEKALVHYRKNWPGQISVRRNKNPVVVSRCVYSALEKIKHFLQCRNLMHIYAVAWRERALVHAVLYSQENCEIADLWRVELLPGLGLTLLEPMDFATAMGYARYLAIMSGEKINYTTRFKYDIYFYKLFFKELEKFKIGLWGFGKLGKKFLEKSKEAEACIVEVYDNDSAKHCRLDDGLLVKPWEKHLPQIDVIITTNHRWEQEIADQIHKNNPNLLVVSWPSFSEWGMTIDQCIIK